MHQTTIMTYATSTTHPTSPPLVSVIIPAYGHAEYILECVESVLGQTYPSVEVIVVDDGSPDHTQEVLAPLVAAGRIQYVRQANAGQAAARNAGVARARGKYLALLDDDDVWPPDALSWRVAILEADDRVGLVFGRQIEFAGEVPALPPQDDVGYDARFVEWRALFTGCPLVSPGLAVIRKDVFDAIGGTDPGIWGADDWDLWFRLARASVAVQVDRVCLLYRRHAANSSRQVARLCDNMMRVVAKQLRHVGPGDVAVARYVALDYLSSWNPLLDAAIRSHLRSGRMRMAARTAGTRATLLVRRALAVLAVKRHLLGSRRWRLDPRSAFGHGGLPDTGLRVAADAASGLPASRPTARATV